MTIDDVRNESILESTELLTTTAKNAIKSIIKEASENNGSIKPEHILYLEGCLIVIDCESQLIKAVVTNTLKELSESFKPEV